MPFFSIIIPTYNTGAKLERSLDSVLAQAGASYEVLVLDGESTDSTLDIIRRYAKSHPAVIRWESRKDGGVYHALNRGIELAAGKYLYFLGAGDRLRPGALAQIEQAAPEDSPALVYGNVYWEGRDIVYVGGAMSRAKLVWFTPCQQSIFYERGVFDIVGRFDTRYPILADWALNMACFGRADIRKVYVPAIIADYEGGGMSETRDDAAFQRDRWEIARRCLGVGPAARLFFTMERHFGERIAASQGWAARKFWHALLWGTERFLTPLAYRER